MNNNIIQAIYTTARVAALFSIVFFAYANEAFAAPTLTPVAVSEVTGTSALLLGHVSNPQKQSTVWFEVGNINGAPTTVAVQGIWSDGTFKWYLDNLNPGQTYTLRAVATDGSNTVYSPTSSFTTVTPKANIQTTVSYQSGSTVATPVQTSVVKSAPPVTKVITVVKEATTTPAVTKEGFTNNSSASVIGSDAGLPTTLIGWMLLLVSLLVMVIIAHMIYEAPEKREKAALAKSKEKDDEEEAKNE